MVWKKIWQEKQLPTFYKPKTEAGNLTYGISEFVGGFIGPSRLLKGVGVGGSLLKNTLRGFGAGAISDYLINTGNFTSDEDSSIAAKYLYLSAKDNYFGYLKSSSHRRRLKNLNLNEDIKYCLTPNQTNVIPILRDGKLVKL